MSKLFNTLEKIRHHETSSEPTRRATIRKPAAAGKSGPSRFLSILLVVMLAVVVLYTALLSTRINLAPFGAAVRQVLTSLHLLPGPEATRTAAPAASISPGTLSQDGNAPASVAEEAARHSASGIAFFRNNDYWRSIYHFDRAHQLNPQAVEPLINMAVALSELGLYGPANRIFREAYALAPDDPALRRNLAILAEAGRLDDVLQSKLRNPGPGARQGR